MIIETAAGTTSADTLFAKYYTVWKAAGYRVLVMLVYARLETCMISGSSRAVREGKKYPASTMARLSWTDGMQTAELLFNRILQAEKDAHGSAYVYLNRGPEGGGGSVFGIVRNNYMDPEMDHSSAEFAACSIDLMAAMNCRVAAAPKMSLYAPEMLKRSKFQWQWDGLLALSSDDAIMKLVDAGLGAAPPVGHEMEQHHTSTHLIPPVPPRMR